MSCKRRATTTSTLKHRAVWRGCGVALLSACLGFCSLFSASLAFGVETPSSAEDILYLGAKPVMIRLNLVVDGKPWRQTRMELARKQFQLIDSDHDGLVQVEQLQGVSLPRFNPDEPDQWDTENKDGKLSLTEFLAVFESSSEAPFLLAEGAGQASSRVKLFSHLDTNSDGKLTESEFEKARHSLARLDYDDDETISTAELTPFANPLVQQAFVGRETPLASDAPFISVGAFDSLSDVAVVMLRRYREIDDAGSDAEETPVDQLSCKVDRIGKPSEVSKYDADGDGRLNHGEMTDFLQSRSPDVTLQIELPSRNAKRPKMKLLEDRIRASKRRVSSRGSSRIDLQAGNASFNLRAHSSASNVADNRSFYLAQFRIADADKNDYLGADEYAMVGLDAPFDVIDLDGDGKLVRDELSVYLDRDAFSSQSQVVLSVAAGTRTLFSTLDRDFDQRLTLREFKGITARVKSLDANRDSVIEASEISQEYRLAFSMGRPRVFQMAMTQQNGQNRNGPSSQATPNSNAPTWYQKMDRNQDGDLSWREFLGKRETFDQLDADSDGLITVKELDSK